MNQLMTVAAAAGRKSRKDLLNELTARLDNAVSMLPCLASLIGFNELTNPESMMKQATQAGPWPTSLRIGLCIHCEGPCSPSPGLTI